MGFIKELFSKQGCAFCGNEVGALSRTKMKDGEFICSECFKAKCSPFFSAVLYTKDEVQKHMNYMEKQMEFYDKVYSEIPEEKKEKIAKFITSETIVFCDELGMFEVINGKTKLSKTKELFRYDQIRDFKFEVKNNTAEGGKKYSEVNIILKLLSDRNPDAELENFFTKTDLKKHTHPYATEFKFLVDRNVDEINGGLIGKKLEDILGLVIETSISKQYANTTRTSYRKIEEVERYFKREHWAEVADNAEKGFMGKTFKDME